MMSKLTKRQQIDALQKCLRTQGIKMRELETRLSTQEKWSEYADNMLTEFNHALPDPEYDAKCEAEVADVEASLDRHRERLGLNKPQLKQLDQSVFKKWDDYWKFFATDEDGDAWRYREKPKIDNGDNRWSSSNTVPHLIGTGYDASNWQGSLIKRKSQPKLKQVDQSIFDGLDEKWKYAAVDADGSANGFDVPVYPHSGVEYGVFLFVDDCANSDDNSIWIGGGYDASNWQNSLIKRKSQPQLMQIDQSVFDGLDSKWKYAAVDGVGTLKAFTYEPKLSVSRTSFILLIGSTMDIGTGYDASNWRDSLIKRDAAKELLEVDLSSELTGSELCKAMLERGDKYVVCFMSYSNDATAEFHENARIVVAHDDKGFYVHDEYYQYAVPINNQGEPLTAKEVGI